MYIYMDSNIDSNMDNTIKKIDKLYNKLTYFDQYAGSVIILVFITIIVFLIICYAYFKSYATPIANDWPNQRCNTAMLPFAGFIYHPSDTTAIQYTQDNFNYCTQNILTDITKPAIEPITFVTNSLNKIANTITDALQEIRKLFNRILTLIADIVQNIYNRLLNITSETTEVLYRTQDITERTEAVMQTAVYVTSGAYSSLQSYFGAIVTALIDTIIILILTFLWIPLIPIILICSIFIVLMKDYLGVNNSEIPQIPSIKCFDKNTKIPMNDGTTKKINEIKLGELLANNNEVTSIIRVKTEGSNMYYLNNVLLSDSHIVNYNNNWIPVFKHHKAILCDHYTEPYLYCLNTTNKQIIINEITFTDWDEIYDQNIINVMHNKYKKINNLNLIHKELDGGFEESTIIQLFNGQIKQIKDILIGDKLINGEEVYGIVEINGDNMNDQFKFILGENVVIEGGSNLVISNSKNHLLSTLSMNDSNIKIKLNKNHKKLYHLLTDKKTFYIGDIKFCDYNASIDIFL